MDQKSWLWKKRSTEKTLVADKAVNSLSKNEQATEVEKLVSEKSDLERDLRTSNEKLSSALSECNAKDDIAKKQVKIAEEAIAGWEKAECEAVCLKQQLDKVAQQKVASEERIDHLDAALKECMQQLRVRDDQEKRIHGAVRKAWEEFEKTRVAMDGENTKLAVSLSEKDRVIENLEAELKALLLRAESTEKENASLKYEVRVLEKELDIRNEEREFSRRSADVAQNKQLESAKRIADLETECQKLRLLVQKRLPGPAMFMKMRNEVKTLNKGRVEFVHGAPCERISLLNEQLCAMAEENRALKNSLHKQSSELQFFRNMNARASSKTSRAEVQVEELPYSDVGSDDKASCAESWASALISELENLKNDEQLRTVGHRNMGASDMNLMDDFAEMEKLAVVSVDYPPDQSSEECNAITQTSSEILSKSDKSEKKFESSVSVPIHKVLELLEGINIQYQDNVADKVSPYRNPENPTGYIVRVFQWKADELSATLQQFVRTCSDLLIGKADLEQFVQQVASNLEWIMNHCFSLQDVSSMKDAIRNNLYWDESRSESESDDNPAECSKLCTQGEDMSYKAWNVEWEDKEPSIQDSGTVKIHLQESKDIAENPDSEIKSMGQSREIFENQIEKQKMIKEDLEMQLTETNHEWRKACERISLLENELEIKSNSCTRLEETCHDLKTQIQSMTGKNVSDNGKRKEKQLQSDWEITEASEKLAQCQETILNLGKQLKALASPNNAALFDKVISKTTDSVSTPLSTSMKSISRRSSLLNKMLAEDSDHHGSSPITGNENQNGMCSSVSTNTGMENSVKSSNTEGFNQEDKIRTSIAVMDIVPRKKNGSRGFFKRLFWPQKKGNCDKIPIS